MRQPYAINWPRAILAVTIATTAITVIMLTIPAMLGIEQMDLGITVAALAVPEGGPAAYMVRVSWHVGNGLLYAFVYILILFALRTQSTALTGALFGVTLLLVGPMTSIPALLDLFSRVQSGELTNPGIFMLRLGLGLLPAAIDLFAHLTHGILTGVIYKHKAKA